MADATERVAVLEAQHQELMRLIKESREDMAAMRSDLAEVRQSLVRWKGVGAGIAIAVSLIWSVAVGIYHIFAAKP